MFKHPSHPEKMDEAITEVRLDIQKSENCQSTTRNSIGLKDFMELERARYAQVPDSEKLSSKSSLSSTTFNKNDSTTRESIGNKDNNLSVLATANNNPVFRRVFRNRKRVDHSDDRKPTKRSVRAIKEPDHSPVTPLNHLQEQLYEKSINRIISIEPINSS